jgi:hypothetical protein
MQNFTRILWIAGFLLSFVAIYYASAVGFGLSGLTDKGIKEGSRDGGGYFMGSRSVRGGGSRYGK